MADRPENPYDKVYHSPEEKLRWLIYNGAQQDMIDADWREVPSVEAIAAWLLKNYPALTVIIPSVHLLAMHIRRGLLEGDDE